MSSSLIISVNKLNNDILFGLCRWGVVHNEKFWKENAKFVEVGEFKMLKELISLIDSSDPVSSAAISAFVFCLLLSL